MATTKTSKTFISHSKYSAAGFTASSKQGSKIWIDPETIKEHPLLNKYYGFTGFIDCTLEELKIMFELKYHQRQEESSRIIKILNGLPV